MIRPNINETKIRAANGSEMPVIGELDVDVEFNQGYRLITRCVVVDNLIGFNMLIGDEFMYTHDCEMRFGKENYIKINKKCMAPIWTRHPVRIKPGETQLIEAYGQIGEDIKHFRNADVIVKPSQYLREYTCERAFEGPRQSRRRVLNRGQWCRKTPGAR